MSPEIPEKEACCETESKWPPLETHRGTMDTCGGCGQVATRHHKALSAWERAVSGGAGTANTLLSGESKHSLRLAPPLAALLSQQVVSTHRQRCEERKALPLTLSATRRWRATLTPPCNTAAGTISWVYDWDFMRNKGLWKADGLNAESSVLTGALVQRNKRTPNTLFLKSYIVLKWTNIPKMLSLLNAVATQTGELFESQIIQ